MIPGRTYSADFVLRFLWRSTPLILLLGLAGAAAAALYVSRLPDMYRSEATLLVRPQLVPEAYVRSTVSTGIDDLVRILSDRVLAPDSVSAINRELNVYPGVAASDEQLAMVTRARVGIQIVRADAFSVSFFHRDAGIAAKVTERLAKSFSEENLRSRTGLAEETDQFLDGQLQSARERLDEHLSRLEEYRRTYAGQLPTQLQANLQVIQNAQVQLQAVTEAIYADSDRRLKIEQALSETTGPEPPEPEEVAPIDPLSDEVLDLRGRDALRQLPAVRLQLERLSLQLRPEHPDIARLKRVIAELERRVESDLGPGALTSQPAAPALERQRNTEALTAELRTIEARLAGREEEATRLRGVINRYQQRVEAIPTRETELTTLMRDYESLRESYHALLQKKEQAQLAAELERRRVGQSLYIAVPPVVASRPFAPQRTRTTAFGLLGGLFAGLLLVGVREYRDSTLRTEAEVFAALDLPVLAVVPVMPSSAFLARGRRMRIAVISVVGIGVIAAAAVLYFRFAPLF